MTIYFASIKLAETVHGGPGVGFTNWLHKHIEGENQTQVEEIAELWCIHKGIDFEKVGSVSEAQIQERTKYVFPGSIIEGVKGAGSTGFIVAEHPSPDGQMTAPGRFLLCCIDNVRHPYATWWQNLEDGGRYHGHYHEAYAPALIDFRSRVNRELNAA